MSSGKWPSDPRIYTQRGTFPESWTLMRNVGIIIDSAPDQFNKEDPRWVAGKPSQATSHLLNSIHALDFKSTSRRILM